MNQAKLTLYRGLVGKLQAEGTLALSAIHSELAKDSPDPDKILAHIRDINAAENALTVLDEYIKPLVIPAPPPQAAPQVVPTPPPAPAGPPAPKTRGTVDETTSATYRKNKKTRENMTKGKKKKDE